MNLRDLVSVAAARGGDALAIAGPDCSGLSYAHLLALIEHTGVRLGQLGFRGGERIAVVCRVGPEMAASFVALGSFASVAPLNPAYGRREMKAYLANLEPDALVAWRDDESPAIAVARERRIPIVFVEPAAETGWFELVPDGDEEATAEGTCRGSRDDDLALVMHTSGTTGAPKVVPLSQANICASAANIAATLQLSPRDRCLNVVPLCNVHGLISNLLGPLSTGGSSVCTGFLAEGFDRLLRDTEATWYSISPASLRSILDRAPIRGGAPDAPGLRFIRSGSAPVPADLTRELERRFGVPVIVAYGMTETASQITSDRLPPGARKPGSVGYASVDSVRVVDDSGADASVGKVGEIRVRGPGVMSGYVANDEANRQAFVEGWFRTGDLGYLDNDRYLFLTGRLGEVINRGGDLVQPREVDEVLLEHPSVTDAVAFAVPHETLGEDLVAAVIVREGFSFAERDLRDFAFERIAGFKVPTRIIQVDEIPRGPAGKLQRIGLAEKLSLKLETPFVAPARGTEETLARAWEEVLRMERVGADDNFFMLGGDSVRATMVVARMRERLGVEVPLPVIFSEPTLRAQAAAILDLTIKGLTPGVLKKYLAELSEMSDEEAERLLREGA